MITPRHFQPTIRFIRYHWPVYFILYGMLVFSVLLIGVSLAADWYSFIPFSIAIMLVASYVLLASVYVAHKTIGGPGDAAADQLFEMSQTSPTDRVVCIDLGLRSSAVTMAQRLTAGKAIVIDVYNPQSNAGSALRRGRDQALKPPDDPRLDWIDGRIDLLPLPDRYVGAVFMDQILSEFQLPEERDKLLAEVFRILAPDGRLLVAERVRSRSNTLLTGPITYNLPSGEHWRNILENAGFIVRREEYLRGLVYCARADKPGLTAGVQMALELGYA